MRAIVVSQIGVPPDMDTLPRPTPLPGEVLIQVSKAALNFADLLMIDGRYQATPTPPFALGLELCGTVHSVGSKVKDFSVGDRVCAQVAGGALAEFAVAAETACWRPPDSMPDSIAAGLQIAYGTSHLALLDRGRLKPGETLVVLGAAGGVGLTAVEIGVAQGANVIAVARGQARLDVARAAGAHHLIDSDICSDLAEALKDLGGVDVVYDAIGGDLGARAFRAIRPEGRHLLIGFASGDIPGIKLNHALVKNIDLIGVYWGGYSDFRPAAMTHALTEIAAWYVDGRIAPRIDKVVPFEDALDALQRLKRREVSGKVIVDLQSAP